LGGALRSWGALAFLLPAAILLGALVAYPIVFTVVRSLYDRSGASFVGVDNYRSVFTNGRTLIALRNNVTWVVVAPSVVTALGLIFAVLSERVSWQTAFKVVVFLPMAISFLAAGVIFRLVYEQDPHRGVANAVVTSVVDTFREPGRYPGARLRDGVTPSSSIPMVGLPPSSLPKDAKQAVEPTAVTKGVAGVVWLDFRPGGGGTPGVIDPGERGLAGMKVEAVRAGKVVATATADSAGRFVLDQAGDVRLAASNFREPFRGVAWLGPTLVTPSVIGAYVWVWAGFAMVVIAAGLAAIPREVLEAARVDGASEWQVFRRVTVPLLAPVLAVVFVTLVINVLKVFDLVLIIPPGSMQDDANVLALEMWRVSFGGARDQGLGSALGVVLFLLVLPAMVFNLRRFRREDDR
jgi:alpha-glucoside transport system permease protein